MDFDIVFQELCTMNIGDVLKNEPLYKHTTFRVGGPAKIYVKVKNMDGLKQLIQYINVNDIDYFIIGKGSNLLFSDRQFDGIIISLNEYFSKFEVKEDTIIAQTGVSMVLLSNVACRAGLSGFEFMAGIPGNIGGGIFMNAGAYKTEIADRVIDVTFLDQAGEVKTLLKEELQFTYRNSIFQKNPTWIILQATFKLDKGNVTEIKELMTQRNKRRTETQPLDLPSAGSVFKNPNGKGAWEYIDECGFRGYEIGGAQISPKHSNFIVNNGYASAKDILDLIKFAQDGVYQKFGIAMHTEIRLVNW